MSKILKESLDLLINGIKEDTNQAKATFETVSTLNDVVSVNNVTRSHHFRIDEPEVLGGHDSGANPVEHILAALGACQAITYKAVATLKGIQLKGVTVKTKGNLDLQGFLGLDKNVRPGYENIEFETIIESDEDPEKLYRLSKQVEQLCPVLDILSHPVPVQGKVTIKNKTAPELVEA